MPSIPLDPAVLAAATAHLAAADPSLARIIAVRGPCTLGRESDLFLSLLDAIISQQLSVKAAETILRRLLALLPGGGTDPVAILALPDAAIRGAGLSGAKMAGVRDLAGRVHAGTLDLAALEAAPDEDVIAALLPVRGIGRWTAEMFLIFALGRLDVLPVADLGFRQAVARDYGVPLTPTLTRAQVAALHVVGAPWRPYRSIATWYLWRSLSPRPNEP